MRHWWPIVPVLGGVVITLWSLWSSPYLPAFHDQYQAERVYEMGRAIAFGQLPPRYVQDLGYGLGYPLFNYYAPFPYYVGSLFYLIGFDLVIATKIMITIGFLLAGLSMYYVASRWWGRAGGTFSAILYLFAPYHAIQLYVRGAIGELYAYAFLPFVLLAITLIFQNNRSGSQRNWVILGLTLLALSHTVSLYMVGLILCLTIIAWLISICLDRSRRKNWPLIAQLIGIPLLITAYFWLPAFSELNATSLKTSTGNEVNYQAHFLEPWQLWDSPWGYGGSAMGTVQDGMSFMIGKAALMFALFTLIGWCYQHATHRHKPLMPATILCLLLCIGLISMLLTFSVSQIIWETVPMMKLIQFPWRWLSVIVATITALSGGFILSIRHYLPQFTHHATIQSQVVLFAGYLIVVLQLVSNSHLQPKFFSAQSYYLKNTSDIIDQQHLTGEVSRVSDEYMYRHIPLTIAGSDQSATISCSSPCRIHKDSYTPDRYALQVQVREYTLITIGKANFPGFKAFINKVEVPIIERDGRLGLALSHAGIFDITYQLFETPIRTIANTISVATLLGLIIYGVMNTKARKV